MDLLFKAIFMKATVTGIAATLAFSSPAFLIKKDRLYINGSLNGIITRKVERIARTGAAVTVTFTVSITGYEKGAETIITRRFNHSFHYDPLKGHYVVRTPQETATVLELSSVNKIISEFQLEIPLKGFKFKSMDAYLDADISYDSALNLDISGPALWDFHIPSRKIRGLTAEVMR